MRKNDLEGGFLELVTDEGDVYRLAGSVEASGRVKVTGKIEKGGFGIHMSGPSITVESVGYQLRATPGDDGVHLEWNPRREEGFLSARVYLHRPLRRSELAHVTGSRYVHTEVKPGRRYRYTVVLEKDEANPGPSSSPVEVTVPKR